MEYKESMAKLCEKEFLDKLYGFAYKRSSTSFEAEDLCSDIILSVINSLRKDIEVESFYGFVWTVAHRVYADYCKKRSRQSNMLSSKEFSDETMNMNSDTIEEFIESEEEKRQLAEIIREISFLSKIYRDVFVMYYIDELSIFEVATRLSISENAVKQRLFLARNTIKKEAVKMEQNFTLKPMDIQFIGTGSPAGNDPSDKAERILSKNVLYLCKREALSPKEISEKLNVPMPFIEDELEILEQGMNGYGLLRRLDNGKYISNFLLIDMAEYNEATKVYTDALEEFTLMLMDYIEKNKEKIINLPLLNPPKDISFIMWAFISDMVYAFNGNINKCLSEKYFSNINIPKRPFTTTGVANNLNEDFNLYFYGHDGLGAGDLCGYKSVRFHNIYGARMEKHYGCSYNVYEDTKFIMLLKSIEGLDISALTVEEKEIAAKAIESRLLEKKGDKIFPKILVFDNSYYEKRDQLMDGFVKEIESLSEKIAGQMAKVIKKLMPKHLIDEYRMLIMLAANPLRHHSIEKCIEKGILTEPEGKVCAEGAWLVVER